MRSDFRGARAVHRALDRLASKYGYGHVLPPLTCWLDEVNRMKKAKARTDALALQELSATGKEG